MITRSFTDLLHGNYQALSVDPPWEYRSKRTGGSMKSGACQQPPVALDPYTVLDPFMGRGTVAIVARDLGRSSIGCELNPDYIEIIKQQLQSNSHLDTGTVEYIFTKV